MDFFNKIPKDRNQAALGLELLPRYDLMLESLQQSRDPRMRRCILPSLKYMRESMDTVLRLTSENLGSHEDTISQMIPGFKYLSESHSLPEFSRLSKHKAVNGRKILEEKIANNAHHLNKYKIVPHLVSLGSGTLGQEMRILHATQMNSTKETEIKKIKLDLIEKEYSDDTLTVNSKLSSYIGKKQSRQEFLSEFATMLIIGLGYNVKLIPTTTNQCTSFYKCLHDLMDGHELGSIRPTLELRIFKNTDEYVQNMQNLIDAQEKNISQANIMYDVDFLVDPMDLDNCESRYKMIQQIQCTTSPNAVHFGLFYSANNRQVVSETNTSIQGVWNAPRFEVISANNNSGF